VQHNIVPRETCCPRAMG